MRYRPSPGVSRPLEGGAHRGNAVVDAELRVDVEEVGLHSFLAYEEPLGDLPVSRSRCDELKLTRLHP